MAAIGFDIRSAVANQEDAQEYSKPYITCETNPEDTVLLFRMGNETVIKQSGKNAKFDVIEIIQCK